MAPASPKDKRRSTRRSAHSSSKSSGSSGSPSPDAGPTPAPPPTSDVARSIASSSSASTGRGKRVKEDVDEPHAPPTSSHKRTNSLASTINGANGAAPTTASKRTKRKGKEAVIIDDTTDVISVADAADLKAPEPTDDGDKAEEDGGITRCVCDGLDDDADAPDFMIQCEQCMAWQHGPCMGFAQESEIPEGNYYCEQCKPEDHVELLKKLARRQRQSSEKSAHKSRTSRSHSPTHFLKPAKRRNTMNSRDAAYEENLQELLESTAAEAAPNSDGPGKDRAESVAKTEPYEEIIEIGPGRKKRKRADDDSMPAKRKRSTSLISDGLGSAVAGQDKPEVAMPITTALLPPPAPTGKSRGRRGGGRKNAAPQESPANPDGEDALAPPAKKHPNQYTYRTKSANGQSRRAPYSSAGQNQSNLSTHEHGTRRNANNVANGGSTGSGSRYNHNAYYNNVQLPMFASWGLPDYLAHLQSILPSEVPPPLEIRGSTSFIREDICDVGASADSAEAPDSPTATRASMGPPGAETTDTQQQQNAQIADILANATESVTERGVKVKWPAKRMSVADMNKRVRALVEWVGREQALALDRERRKIALENAVQTHLEALRLSSSSGLPPTSVAAAEGQKATDATPQEPPSIILDDPLVESLKEEQPASDQGRSETAKYISSLSGSDTPLTRPSTSKMMEELMEELINFQERFGPGVKGQIRERRVAVLS